MVLLGYCPKVVVEIQPQKRKKLILGFIFYIYIIGLVSQHQLKKILNIHHLMLKLSKIVGKSKLL